MFGFQRTGDGLWAAADQLARGFLIGATAGKTTLTGEGTQHLDGHSPLLAATNPAVHHYDPAYGYEIAHIMRHGLETMLGPKPDDAIFYLTVYNEPIEQPGEPADIDVDGIIRGLYLLRAGDTDGLPGAPRVQLLASGVAVPWALEAQQLLRQDAAVVADVWSVTSWNELRREAEASQIDQMNGGLGWEPYLSQRLKNQRGPVIGVSDFARAVPNQIAPWLRGRFHALGADGFGFSDTRIAARRWLRIDAPSIVVKALQALAEMGQLNPEVPGQAYQHYQLDQLPTHPARPNSASR
jgi:pyruvate dehydrogenase E1 component